MKKILLSVALVAGIFSANAQEVKFGAKAGLNLANFGGDIEDADSRLSFHVGGVAEIMISEKFSVQPELVFSSQGFKFEESGTEEFFGEEITYNTESTIKLNYINLPIMAKYYVADGFSIEGGPQVGFLMSANSEFESSATFQGQTETESGDEDVKDDFKGIDFAFGLGAGYKLDSGLNFSLRYNLGLSNILEDSGDFSAQNNVFQFSVGYFF